MLAAVKQYLGGNEFKDDIDVQRIVTRWLMTKDTRTDMKREK
jgi:hypothetical protein